MEVRKYRWSKTYEAGEGELINLLEAKKIDAERWAADEFEVFEPHIHAKDKRVWCAEGSITFKFTADNKTFPLQAGDTLDVPANTFHEGAAGFAGCICYEFPRTDDNPMLKA